MPQKQRFKLCIIGGAGHVGLPLGVAFANKGVSIVLNDINKDALAKIVSGVFPFKEANGRRALRQALIRGKLAVSSVPESISQSEFILVVIGTPVDEYLNPDFNRLMRTIERYEPYFRNGQILILRSTVYPGTSERVQHFFKSRGKKVSVSFCPERIAQGTSLEELAQLPQIVSAFDHVTVRRVSTLFKSIAPSIIVAGKPIEAELAKLFSNAWRYIKFAVANQFFMIAGDHGLDYQMIHEAMVKDYERNADLPRPGFSAGPCLLKDTMQLAAFNNNNFFIGHSAMLVNEGLPNYLIQQLKRMKSGRNLKSKTIGILGMAFKAESDDSRDSLSYKLRKLAEAEAGRVLCTDVYIKDRTFQSLKNVLAQSDIIILAAPHRAYRSISPARYPNKQFLDIWGVWPTRRNAVHL